MKGGSSSQSYTYQAVPLLRPEKVMRLSEKKILIMRTGHATVKAGQFIWYKEKVMRHLKLKEIEIPKLKLGKDH